MSRICKHVEALAGYVPGEQPHFPGMVKLNTNENPYPPSPKVGEALAAFDWKSLRLYPDPVFMRVREIIARNVGCRPSQVFVGNGSDEILALFTRAFVEVGGTVGYFDPTYSLYSVLAAIRDVWTNPNAPTSLLAAPEQIADFAKGYAGVVLVDEAYADFGPANCMALATAPDNENLLVMRTLSKSFSLAGLRFGYCVGPEPLIEALYKIKDSYNMDALAQVIGAAALEDLPHMRANVAKVQATRTRLTAALEGRGWRVLPSSTNFLFARPPEPAKAADLFAALRDRHIFLRYFPGPRTGEWIRITVGSDAEVDTLLAALDTLA